MITSELQIGDKVRVIRHNTALYFGTIAVVVGFDQYYVKLQVDGIAVAHIPRAALKVVS